MQIAKRDKRLVEAELSVVAAELITTSEYRYRQRLQGSRDCLEWALGRRPEAPVSERLIENPDAVALSQENAWAYEVVIGARRPPSEGRDRNYAGGAEEALCWLLGSDDAIPMPFE
jgi:hypothetical protein